MLRVILLALIIAYVNADAGGSNPAFTQTATFTVTVSGSTDRSATETAIDSALGNTVDSFGGSGDVFEVTTLSGATIADLTLPGSTFCVDLSAAEGCVTDLTYVAVPTDSTLDPLCETGNSGLATGEQIYMDYDQTGMSVGDDGSSVFTVVFDVPTQYFFTNQSVGDSFLERSIAITWHARNETDQSGELQGSCYTTQDAYEHCQGVTSTWMHEDSVKGTTVYPESCTQSLTGKLNFDALLNLGDADPTLITVQTEEFDLVNTQDENSLNHTTEQWAIYMIAVVETWNGFYEVAHDAGAGNIESHTPDDVDLGLDWTGNLAISETRYSQYMIPFKITFPKEITLDYTEVTTVGRLVVLSAIIDQQIVNINFTPSDGMFGEVLIKMKTQTQYPFGLNGYNGEGSTVNASASVERVWADGGINFHNAKSIEFTGYTPMSDCTADAVAGGYATNAGSYCEQTWDMTILPQECSVDGNYQIQFWAQCYDSDPAAECALDNLQYDDTTMVQSNAWSGVLTFSIATQSFCPEVIDEVSVQAFIYKYIDNGFTQTAVPGTNLFSNDHLYVETELHAASAKSGLDVSVKEGDDSLIDFVRPYKMTIDVSMTSPPVQFELVLDTSHGDVTIHQNDGSAIEYEMVLCEVLPQLSYPYDTSSAASCFDSANIGHFATEYLDFSDITSTSNNTIDSNEIGIKIRLDERAIPVDLPNHPVSITLSQWIEVYYVDDTHPSRRVVRRGLQTAGTQQQGMAISDSFLLYQKPGQLDYCSLNPSLMWAGFQLDMKMNILDMPTSDSANDDVLEIRYDLVNYLNADWNQVQVYQVDRCSEDACTTVYPRSRRSLQEEEYVRYFIEVRDPSLANKLQTDLINNYNGIYTTGPMAGKVLKHIAIDHCDTELQPLFNEWRSADSPVEAYPEDDSVASWTMMFIVALVAALY